MFPRYTSAGLFDIDNFFATNPIDHVNNVAHQFQRLSTTYPTYSPHPWEPISRISQNSASPDAKLDPHKRVPRSETFRIRMALPGYAKEDIKTSVEKGKLVIFARHIDWITDEDYSASEIKRHFFIPENCNFGEMKTQYDGQRLFIDIPLRLPRSRASSSSAFSWSDSHPQRGSEPRSTSRTEAFKGSTSSLAGVPRRTQSESEAFDYEQFFKSSFRPSIQDVAPGKKKLIMSIPLPNVAPEQINLSLRDNELTLKIEERENVHKEVNFGQGTTDDQTRLHYVHRTQLPPKTDLDGLRSRLDDGVLFIEAPYKVE